MKNLFPTILILSLLIFSCKKENNGFVVKGTLKNIPDSTRVFIHNYEQESYSAIVINGNFEIIGKVEEPTKIRLIIPNSNDYRSFWLENNVITFKAEKGKFNEALIEGSKTQITESIIFDKIEIVRKKTESLEKRPKNRMNLKEADSIRTEYYKLLKEQEIIYQDFIREYPNSVVSANILNTNTSKWERQKVNELYNKLSKENKKSIYGKSINEFLNSNRKTSN